MVPAIWIAWGTLLVLVAVLKLYTARLGRDEEDQLFLDESSQHQKTAQAAIAARLHRVEPIQRVALWVLGAATLFVVIYYVLDMIHQFR
jgi:hypothetical protein